MSEYADDLAGVEVKGMTPNVAKNDALGKLKKEMEKKQQSKNGEHKMTDKQFVEQAFQAFVNIYRWVNYHQGVSDIDDFISKLRGYTDCEQWFGFSDEFIQVLIGVIASSKRNFGIAIERFKMLPFEFALEDVPVELAKRMVQKLDVKKAKPMICDCCFAGPTLLKQVAAVYPNAILFAVIPKDAYKLRAIARKEFDRVNIIEELSMNFDHIIMNPPYSGNLHLKILREAMKHSDDIVNLSPIRWLQDPLADRKENTDYKRFADIREHIDDLYVISQAEAFACFGVYANQLGIYHIKPNAKGYVLDKSFVNKILSKTEKFYKDYMNHKKTPFWVPVSKYHFTSNGCETYEPFTLSFSKNGTYAKSGWTKALHDKWEMFYFDSEEEKKNFEDFLELKSYKFILGRTQVGSRLSIYTMPMMPDYTHHWTDSDLYAYFGLTADEIDTIEKEMTKYE